MNIQFRLVRVGQVYQNLINYFDLILTGVKILLTGKTKINSYNSIHKPPALPVRI